MKKPTLYLDKNIVSALHYDGTGINGVIPKSKFGDALQLALAAGHQADYLVTWNYAHLANPVTQSRADHLLQEWKCRGPLLVSPESIPQVRFHQSIRRKPDG